ncbi:MAG TPA: glycosyltransferase [Bacteroidia bacterium]|jgi:glycosyltransferase involved in cell wall biosynthesis|nr:glycosyltransferase [Bacteroidia bacterium]
MPAGLSEKIKIGFWGNANNYPFMLARTFRKQGHEVLFIIDDDQRLNRPENRFNDITLPYPAWIKDYSPMPLWLSCNIISPDKKKQVISDLQSCDLIILNGYAMRFATEIKKPHVTLITGSDLDPLANYGYLKKLKQDYLESLTTSNLIPKGSKTSKILNNKFALNICENLTRFKRFSCYDENQYFSTKNSTFYSVFFVAGYFRWLKTQIRNQREAIKNAIAFTYFSKGLVPYGEQLLKEIGANQKKRLFNLMIDSESISVVSPPKNEVIRIFNLARFNWIKDPSSPSDFISLDYKGNDIMIKGIHLFTLKYPETKLNIHFVKKGKDVNSSMALCDKLGISKHLTWHSEFSQKELLEEYKKADIVFDQMGKSVVAMGGFEAMAMGRPLIANARPEVFDKILGEETSICHAQTPEEVCNWIEKLVFNPGLRDSIGKKSRQFVEKHFSTQKMAERILNAYNLSQN